MANGDTKQIIKIQLPLEVEVAVQTSTDHCPPLPNTDHASYAV